MIVQLGNTNPRSDAEGPAVTTINTPDEGYSVAEPGYQQEVGPEQVSAIESAADLAVEAMRQVASGGGVTHLPGQESLLSVIACWNAEGAGKPTWVASDNPDFETLLAEFFGCPQGMPDDVEMTHFTVNGPPGVGPVAVEEASE